MTAKVAGDPRCSTIPDTMPLRLRRPLFFVVLSCVLAAAGEVDPASVVSQRIQTEYAKKAAEVPATADGQWDLAVWCRSRALVDEERVACEQVIALSPDHLEARRRLGFERMGTKWLRGEELYKAKGWVRHLGRWMAPAEVAAEESRRKRLRDLARARADWSNAWQGETRYFKIRSNAPGRIVEETGRALDLCVDTLAKIFRPRSMPRRIPLEMYATQAEFARASAVAGMPVGQGTLGYFYRGSDLGIRCFHAGSLDRTLGVLFHECTHLMVYQSFGDQVPTWANEGMAVFMEFAKVSGTSIDIRTVPWDRLWHLQDMLDEKDQISLNRLAALSGEYTVQYYPQGWGLVWFLLYADQGKYRPKLEAFYQQKQTPGMAVDAFRAAFGVAPDDLLPAWRSQFAAMEPKTTSELCDAALAAARYRYDLRKGLAFADQAIASAATDWKPKLVRARVLFAQARLSGRIEHWHQAAAAFGAVSAEREAALAKQRGKPALADLAITAEHAIALARGGGPGDCQRAVELCGKSIAADEADPSAYRSLAEIATVATDPVFRDLAAAGEHLAVADDLGPGHENDYVRALLLAANNQVPEALMMLDRAAALDAFGFGAALYQSEAARLKPKPAAVRPAGVKNR